MAVKTINKKNDENKNKNKKKVNINNNNLSVKKRRESILDTLNFEMSRTEQLIEDKRNETTLCIDEQKESLINTVKGFTFNNNEVYQDVVEFPLVDAFIPDNCGGFNILLVRASDYCAFSGRDNLRGQEFGDTAKSVLRTTVYRPERYLHRTSSFLNLVCDSFNITKDYAKLKGDVQVTDGETRSQLFEELKRLGGFEGNLENIVIPISVKLREDYESDIEFINCCVAQNVSKAVSYYERANGYKCFDSVPTRFGKYADRIVMKKSELTDGKIYLKDILSAVMSQDCTMFKNEITPSISQHYSREGLSDAYLRDLISIVERQGSKFNEDLYFGYINDIGEDFADFYFYLLNEFEVKLSKLVEEGTIDETQKRICFNGKKWVQSAFRITLNAARYFIREDDNGKYYYLKNPKEVFSDDLFVANFIRTLYSVMAINQDDVGKSKTSIEARTSKSAEVLYKSVKKF